MTVVRDLLIRIGFKANKKTQNATNKVIKNTTKSLKTTATQAQATIEKTAKAEKSWFTLTRKMALGWVGALVAVKKVFSYFNNVAMKALDTDILARSLGVAREEFLALNSAARDFGFKDNQFTDALGNLEQLLEDSKNGLNSLSKINRDFQVNIDPNGTALEALRTILEGVKTLDTESSRKNILKTWFKGLEIPLSDLSQKMDNFFEEVQNLTAENKSKQSPLGLLKEYNEAFNKFSDSFERFINQLGVSAFPVLTATLEVLTKLLEVRDFLLEHTKKVANADFVGIGKSAVPFADYLISKGKLGYEFLADNLSSPINNLMPTASFGGKSPVNVTINNDIQIPYGTNNEQMTFMIDTMNKTFRNNVFDVFRDIENNNPRME